MLEDWLVVINPRINHVMDTDASIQIRVHPYTHNGGCPDISFGVDDLIRAAYVYIRLNTTSPIAPAKFLLNTDKNGRASTSLSPTPSSYHNYSS